MNYPNSLNNLLKQIGEIQDSLYLVILFGSYARGEAGKYSDIDLLIVIKNDDKSIHDKIIAFVETAMAEENYNELLSPHIIDFKHYQKLKEYKTDFFRSLEDEGKVLWKAA